MKLLWLEWAFIGGIVVYAIGAIVYGIMRDSAEMARLEEEFRKQQEWERHIEREGRRLARQEQRKK